MGKIFRLILILLTVLFIVSSLSCQSIESKLNNIEKKYSQEFRFELESIKDLEQLKELLGNEDEIEILYNRFLKLEDIEENYSHSFREAIEEVKDFAYLLKLLDDDELINLLNDIYVWKQGWLSSLVKSNYSNEDLRLIIQTVKEFSGNDVYREVYLNYVLDKNSDISFLSLEGQSKIFKKFYDDSYPIENISSFLNKLKENKDYYNDAADHYNKILIQLRLDEIENKYSLELRKKLESIEDENYIKAILGNDDVLESCSDFLEWKRFGDIMSKKYSIGFLNLLNKTVQSLEEKNRNTYIDLVTNNINDKALSITLVTCYLDCEIDPVLLNTIYDIHKIENIIISNVPSDWDNINVSCMTGYDTTNWYLRYPTKVKVYNESPIQEDSELLTAARKQFADIERVNYTKQDFIDFLITQLQREDIGTYYINIMGHAADEEGNGKMVQKVGGAEESLLPSEIVEITNEYCEGKVVNLLFRSCYINRSVQEIEDQDLMSNEVGYRNIIGDTDKLSYALHCSTAFLLSATDIDKKYISRSEIATFDELIAIQNGINCSHTSYYKPYDMTYYYYYWLSPHLDAAMVDGKTGDLKEEFGENFLRITNSNINDEFAPLIVITPGDDDFFESSD